MLCAALPAYGSLGQPPAACDAQNGTSM